MSARFTSGVFLALGFADLAVLNLQIAPRFAEEQQRRAAESVAARAPVVAAVVHAAPPPPERPVAREDPKPAPTSRGGGRLPDVPFSLQSELVTSLPAARSLERLAHEMKSDPARKVLLRGHTDRLGRPGPNLALGMRRAEAVKRYLVMHGAPDDRIAVEAVGDAEPADPGDTPTAWAKNRRVEVLVR